MQVIPVSVEVTGRDIRKKMINLKINQRPHLYPALTIICAIRTFQGRTGQNTMCTRMCLLDCTIINPSPDQPYLQPL